MSGTAGSGDIVTVQITAPGSKAANPAFDVTPARLITGLMTERGIRDRYKLKRHHFYDPGSRFAWPG